MFPLRALVATLLVLAPASAQGSPVPPPQLTVTPAFPVIGGTVDVRVDATPGAAWLVWLAGAPARIPLGVFGTLYLNPAGMIVLASGVVPAGGTVTAAQSVPNEPDFVGAVLHMQAAAAVFPDFVLSEESRTIRLEAAPPSGPRGPSSVAVTPDGSRAYVAHRRDGTVSILDPALDTVLADLPVGPGGRSSTSGALRVAVDPSGEDALVLDPISRSVVVIDTDSDSISATIAVPTGSARLAFDYSPAGDFVAITNAVRHEVLVLQRLAPSVFVPAAVVPLEGRKPGAIAALGNKQFVVGNNGSHDLELIDWSQPAGSTTLARLPLARLPHDLLVRGNELLVSTFTHNVIGPPDGKNHVLRVDLGSFVVTGLVWEDEGTDYLDMAAAGSWIATAGTGSGTVLVANESDLVLRDRVVLAPGDPTAVPEQVAFVTPGGGAPTKLYAVNAFRETVRSVPLTAGPPFALGTEIPLAHLGRALLPLADLDASTDGDRFFRSIDFFNGTPLVPNPVTCATCHPDAGADGLNHPLNTPGMFRTAETGPFTWGGSVAPLPVMISTTFLRHGIFPGPAPIDGLIAVNAFLTSGSEPPPSPFLLADGSLTPAAQAGKLLFEGAAQCSSCHTAPLFIPTDPGARTIVKGVGTGLAPANVPSLRGIWITAPYLHDGSATTLEDVILQNTNDLHGVTSGLTPQQRADLVAYLQSL